MSHLLRYPAGGSYTATVTLNPALVVIQEFEEVRPVQRVLVTPTGKQWTFQLSTNRRQVFRVIIEILHEADSGGFSGLTTLRTFFENTMNYAMNPCDLTHDDGATTTVRLIPDSVRFTETLKAWWTGEFLLQKSF